MFERNTQKPTAGVLEELIISAIDHYNFGSFDAAQSTTIYPWGRWLVELICLIPLHIAVASGNRFVPLKDGILSPEFEQALLGADVLQIAERSAV